MPISLRTNHALTASEFERRGGDWNPQIHWIVPTNDEAVSTLVQSLLDKHATSIEAYSILLCFDNDTCSIELQFHDESVGERCQQQYIRGFRKGGCIPKQKQAQAKGAKKRVYSNRMYRLPDGECFFYFAKWDRHGNLVGKVLDDIEGHLRNKIVHRSILENSVLIPKGDEPWVLG